MPVTATTDVKKGRPIAEVKPLYPESKAWMKFYNGCPNKATCRLYQDSVSYYMRNLGIDDPQKLLEGTPEQIEDNILTFVQAQKKDEVSGDLVNSRISAVKKFYKKNRMSKLIDWEYIREDVGEIRRKTGRNSGGDDYTVEQVRIMRKIADEREAAVLMLYWSAGVRRGVGPALERMDLRSIDGLAGAYNIFEITGYRGFDEEYRTWCSTESRSDLEAYFKFRERYGETIGPHSPVIRDKFDTDDPFGAKYPHKISEQTIYNILAGLAERAGIREQVTLTVGEKPGKVRHKVKAVHGLRKGFDTVCTNSGVTPLWVEFFEGRQLQGSKGRYYRPTDQQLLEGIHETNMRGYVHCIDSLTLNEENRLKQENVQLKEKVDDIQLMKARLDSQETQLQEYQKYVGDLKTHKETMEIIGGLIDRINSGEIKLPKSEKDAKESRDQQ